jgi:hypothetical protein
MCFSSKDSFGQHVYNHFYNWNIFKIGRFWTYHFPNIMMLYVYVISAGMIYQILYKWQTTLVV